MMNFEEQTIDQLKETRESVLIKIKNFGLLDSETKKDFSDHIKKLMAFLHALDVFIAKNDSSQKDDEDQKKGVSKDYIIEKLRSKISNQAITLSELTDKTKISKYNEMTPKQIKQARKLIQAQDERLSHIFRDLVCGEFGGTVGMELFKKAVDKHKINESADGEDQ